MSNQVIIQRGGIPGRSITPSELATMEEAINAANTVLEAKNRPLVQLTNVQLPSANTITSDLPSYLTGYSNGQIFYFFAIATNTGPVTLNIGGLGAIELRNERDLALAAGDLIASVAYIFRISSSGGSFTARIIASHFTPRYILDNAALTGTPTAPTPAASSNDTRIATTAFVQEQLLRSPRTLASVTGVNDLTASMPTGMTAYVAGQVFILQMQSGPNTGPATLNIGGLGALPLNDNTGAALQAGDLQQYNWYVVRNISATSWRIIIPSPLPRQLIATAAEFTTDTNNDRIASSWSPNLIADPYLEEASVGGVAPGWSTSPTVVVKQGMNCAQFPAQGSTAANSRWAAFLDVSGLATGTPISIGVTIAEKNGTSTAGHRLRVYAYDASGTTVSMAGIAGNDIPADSAYNRYIPTEAITTPRHIAIMEGVPLPANVVRFALDIRLQDSPATYITGFVARLGDDPSLTSPFGEATGGTSSSAFIHVATTGNDGNTGTAAAPLATLQAAVTKLGGNGSIYLANGDYAAMRIDPATITGHIRIIGKRAAAPNYDRYPRIFLASKLTGITKTAGFTKVYEAPVSDLPTLANFNWAYQDGVPDPRTAIADANRSPQHRGRFYRLQDMCKLVKTTATTLSAALAEIDAADANDPRAFIDAGVLYFSIVGGGDGTAANIYVDAGTGLFSSGSREACGGLEMIGVEVRYGGMNLRPFRYVHLDEVRVSGARENAIDYSVLSFGTLEVAAAGSSSGTTGDGLNGHYGSKLHGLDLYTHDCRDDGFSDHEGCTSRLFGGLAEANGGTALAPAYGSDHIARNFISRGNQTISGRKPAAFAVIGKPSDAGSNSDQGADTNALWEQCISIGDRLGFQDVAGGQNYGTCIDCKVYDLVSGGTFGYDITTVMDCGFSSTVGSAKSSRTGVKNTTLVS